MKLLIVTLLTITSVFADSTKYELLECYCVENQRTYTLVKTISHEREGDYVVYDLQYNDLDSRWPNSDRILLGNGSYMNIQKLINNDDEFNINTKYDISATRNPSSPIRDISLFKFHVDKNTGAGKYEFRQKINFITIKKENLSFMGCKEL